MFVQERKHEVRKVLFPVKKTANLTSVSGSHKTNLNPYQDATPTSNF